MSPSAEVPSEIRNRDIPAHVPGCVHLDLLRENLIPDPYVGKNEKLVQWIGRTDWEFSTTFSLSADALKEERVDLVCEGLDTVATIWMNGVEIGHSENMHVEARFEAKAALREGDNEIRIRFDSPVHYARAMRDRLGDLPHANSYPDCEPFHFIRKNACNFGWDWGPALTTSGIWKAIRLEAWSVARIKSVRPLVKMANERVAVVEVVADIELLIDNPREDLGIPLLFATNLDTIDPIHPYRIEHIERGMTEMKDTYFIENPLLWCPQGYGKQPLYNCVIAVGWIDDYGSEHWYDILTFPIGLREVELDTSSDDIGAAWTLKVNGQEIWCKGANWIPDDVFLTRANEPERLRERLQQACDMGMNTVRIWGGGIYETDEFYSICDELGLLVWQDFPFACAAYSEESPIRELVEAEARFNVARLAKHPSLVLWNGCNENIWGYFDWGWEQKCEGRTWGAGYYFDILPSIVKELDPTRPYWPGSPYSGSMDIHPNADQFGNKHMWDTWNEVNFSYFRKYSPRFASEFGHQAPPTFATLKGAIPESELNPFSPSMLHHQKATNGNDKLHNRLKEHFEMPDTSTEQGFVDWIYLTQLVQTRAMTTAVEWFRTRKACRGALYWQLNDCWPATSWSAIDSSGHPKPLYYASKQFFRERLLTIQPDGEHLALWAHNDTNEDWWGNASIDFRPFAEPETIEYGWEEGFRVSPRSSQRIVVLSDLEVTDKSTHYLSVMDAGAFYKHCWFFDIDKHLAYPEPKFEAELVGNRLIITARTLIRDLYLNADRVGAKANVNLVTLLPGETWEVELEGGEYDLETLISRPVLMCANWFGRKV